MTSERTVFHIPEDDDAYGKRALRNAANLLADETVDVEVCVVANGDGARHLLAEASTAEDVRELLDDGVLVSDSARGAVWRATDDGAEAWFDSPLLNPNPYADSAIGINGIDVGPEGDLYAANLNFGAIVRIPVEEGTPGDSPEVIVQSDDLVGADGIAVDDQRNVYVAVNGQNKVSMVTADGSVETVISGGELDFPSDVHFGPGDDQSTLYVCNFAFVAFQSEDETANPNLMRIDLGGGAA
jgi:hypothetical protein